MISNPTSREEITLPRLFIKRLKPSQIRIKTFDVFLSPKERQPPKNRNYRNLARNFVQIWKGNRNGNGIWGEGSSRFGRRKNASPSPPSTSARISRRHKRKTVQAGPAVINLQAKQGSFSSYSSTLTLSYLFLSTPVE